MVRVKICGLSRKEDVEYAVAAGADAVGFIVGFPRSPRNISLSTMKHLASEIPPFVDSVLVTTDEVLANDWEEVVRLRPDAIQAYGKAFSPSKVRTEAGVSLIKPILLDASGPLDSLSVEEFDAVLTDTHVPGMQGGTGKTSEWSLARRVGETISPKPLILSGGLTPDNVGRAIQTVRPFAVDVSSGVESTPGRKDHEKIKRFILNAKGVAVA